MRKRKSKCAIFCIAIIWLSGFKTYAYTIDYKAIYKSNAYSESINTVMEELAIVFEDITTLETIGYSTVGNIPLYCIKVGNGQKAILINGAHHARESMTSLIVLAQLKDLCEKYTNNEYYKGKSVRELLNTVSIYFVPLVNPDGVNIAMNEGKPSWKSNGRGVDLNRNYPTPKAKSSSSKYPGSSGYIGAAPFSENETLAMKQLCEQVRFETDVAYHSAGEIIYWWWYQTGKCYADSLKLLKEIQNVTQYQPVSINQSQSGRGFTDWFIQEFDKPGFTIEIGRVANQRPLAWSEFERAYHKNKDIPLLLIDQLIQMNTFTKIIDVEQERLTALNIYDYNLVSLGDINRIYGINFTIDNDAIILEKDTTVAQVVYHSNKAVLNGTEVTMALPVIIRNNTTYIPISFINHYMEVYKKAEELPIEELPVEELPTEELPTEELPTEELPTEELPTEELPTEELPTEELPTEELPTDELAVGRAS